LTDERPRKSWPVSTDDQNLAQQRAVVNMTKDQLKALPAFKYLSDASRTTTRTSPAPIPAPAR